MRTNPFAQYKGLRKENYILFLGKVVTNLGAMIWPVLTLIMNQKLGMNATTVALVMIAAGAVQMPLGLLGGKLADRYNKKWIIVVCDAISIAFYIICGLIPLSGWTIIFITIAASCQGMEQPSYDSLIADINKTKDRERAYSLSYLGMNLGLVASPTIAGLLFAHYLWLAFLISGAAIGLSTVLITLYVKDIRPEEETEDSAVYQTEQGDASVFKILKENKLIVLYIVVMALYWGSYGQYGYLMPLDMATVHGEMGALLYGSVSSLNCIIVVLFTPILTYVFRRLCYTKKIFAGISLVLLGYVVFLCGLGFIPAYYLAITLFTWGEIFSTISGEPYLTERIPASHRGRINGVMTVVQTIVTNVIMLAVGMLYDHMGSVASWTMIFILLAFALMGSVIIIIRDRLRYTKLYKS